LFTASTAKKIGATMGKVHLDHPEAFERIVTNNLKMLSIFQQIESIAGTSQPVLITGETGVGKELVSRAIHSLSGLNGDFVAVNVAGLDDNIFSDTIFGHAKGAFTGAERSRPGLVERAENGTLFLDEIGDMTPSSQVKLLRLLQECEYLPLGQDDHKKTNARIVLATNEDLWTLQREGKFRKDLNYRLRTHHIHIPPLRERMDDIRLLVNTLTEESARSQNRETPALTKELYALLASYSFPGNIRELQAMIFDAVSRQKGKTLSLKLFKTHMERGQEMMPECRPPISSDPYSVFFPDKLPTLKEMARILVVESMERSHGNQSKAAKILGISQPALSKRLKNMDP
jgi:DNA-binding NtrC family response regulator